MASALVLGFLAASPLQSGGSESTPRQQYDALLKDYHDLSAQGNQAYEQAKTQQDREAARQRWAKELGSLAHRAVELAGASPSDPVAIEALAWTLRLQEVPATRQKALDLLARDHVTSDRVTEACRVASGIFSRPDSIQAEQFLRLVVAENPNPRVRGNACFDFASFLVDRAKHLRWLSQHPAVVKGIEGDFGPEQTRQFLARDPAAILKEADALFCRVIEEFPDLRNKTGGTPLGEQARGRLFRLRNLQVGCNAPEIDGLDIDGQRFRLSDYRGKVVLLTFCGNWCPPCRALYPKERELIRRFAGKPFVVLSVNSDEDKETLRQSVKSGEVTWRCWWDGGTSGPISRSWGISYSPTVFIIDARGTIRFEDLPEAELERALETLVKEGTTV